MTRWLRFLLGWVAAKRRPALGPKGEVVQLSRAWPSECDAAFMNHAAILVLCEATRIELMVRAGFFAVARRRGWYFPTAAVYAQYRRPIRRFARVTVTACLAGWDDEELWVQHRVLVGEHVAALLAIRAVVREGRTKVAPADVARELWPGAASPALPEWMKRIRAGDAACRAQAAHPGGTVTEGAR